MKKIKLPKSLLVKFSCVLLVLGVAIMTFGFMKGPSGYIYYMNGIKTGNSLKETNISEKTEPFNEIQIDSIYQNIEIKSGEDYSVSINSKTPYITPKFVVENGVLTVDYLSKNTDSKISVNITPNTYEQVIIITVPENVKISSLKINFDKENSYNIAPNQNFLGVHVSNYVELKNISIENLEYQYIPSELKINECNIDNLTLNECKDANIDNTSIGTFIYNHINTLKFDNCKAENIVAQENSDNSLGNIYFVNAEIKKANINCEHFSAKDSNFVNLTYNASMNAEFDKCKFENVNGVSADETTMSVVGNIDDYSLDLKAEDSAKIVTKIVDCTDPYYQLGYDTEETLSMGTVKVYENENSDVYERLLYSNSYIEHGSKMNENADETVEFVLVNAKREVKYFVEDEEVYYITDSGDSVVSDIESFNTIRLEEVEERFSNSVITVNSEKYYNGSYKAQSKTDTKKSISISSTQGNVKVSFS